MMWILNLLKFNVGRLLGLVQRYVLPLVFLAGMLVVAFIWWQQPSCKEKAAIIALETERTARVKAEKIVTTYLESIHRLDGENRKLKTRVKDYVPANSDCDLSRGAVGLLNSARTGVSQAAGHTAYPSTAPSTVTEQAATEYWIEDVTQCRQWRDQLIQLQEWYRN